MQPGLQSLIPPRELLEEVPVRIALHYCILPLGREKEALLIAAPEDLPRPVREELRVALGKDLVFVPHAREEIKQTLLKFYGVAAGTVEALAAEEKQPAPGELQFEILDEDKKKDASISKLVNELILDALHARASDIHIEPFENVFRIRYRVDGLLRDAGVNEKIHSLAAALVSRIKIMARLDIGEKRLPQDGRIKVRRGGEELDLRVSVLPSGYGEAIAIRILRPLALLGLEELGFFPEMLGVMRGLLARPQGLILVTGPTGSGKTTTLYACLKELNSIERKILTIEDPVEYKLPGIIQMQVNPKIGFHFNTALRSILRHDPDCIMVGEIRDGETARLAVSAALTGHLVFSTMHTNDAPSAAARLVEMGIEPYLAASSVEAVVGQRLIRRRCGECLKKEAADCSHCMGAGFYGRIAVYEILKMTENVREIITLKGSASAVRARALADGFLPLREDGLAKVRAGMSTESELRKIFAD